MCSFCISHPFHLIRVLLCNAGSSCMQLTWSTSCKSRKGEAPAFWRVSDQSGRRQSVSGKNLTHFEGESGTKRSGTYTWHRSHASPCSGSVLQASVFTCSNFHVVVMWAAHVSVPECSGQLTSRFIDKQQVTACTCLEIIKGPNRKSKRSSVWKFRHGLGSQLPLKLEELSTCMGTWWFIPFTPAGNSFLHCLPADPAVWHTEVLILISVLTVLWAMSTVSCSSMCWKKPPEAMNGKLLSRSDFGHPSGTYRDALPTLLACSSYAPWSKQPLPGHWKGRLG